MFHQMEGLVVDKHITFADLKGLLHNMAVQLYGPNTVTRFRPHHFPFTEPSCEMDVLCHKCGGKGCPTCKGEGWIELLGAGVTNPHVHEMSGIDPATHSGLAWGMGLERAAMRRFKIATCGSCSRTTSASSNSSDRSVRPRRSPVRTHSKCGLIWMKYEGVRYK